MCPLVNNLLKRTKQKQPGLALCVCGFCLITFTKQLALLVSGLVQSSRKSLGDNPPRCTVVEQKKGKYKTTVSRAKVK